jgi:hypothetical protein
LFELLNAMLCAVFNLMNSILKQYVAFTTFTLFVMGSTQKHGMSLLTLYRRSAMLPGPCLLVFFFPAEAESSFNMVSDVLNLFQETPFPDSDTCLSTFCGHKPIQAV